MESTDLYALVEDDRTAHLLELLEMKGLHDDEISVRPAQPGRYQLHDERLYEEGVSARAGLLTGIAVGAVIGLAVAALVGAVDTAGEVLATMVAFAGLSGLVGGMAGLQRAERNDDDPVTFREVGPDDHVSLVEVHNEHWNRRAHRVLQRYGAEIVQEPQPV